MTSSTPGTTGPPKGAALTHANLARNADVPAGLFSLDGAAITLGALPLFHSFGQTCGMNATIRGAGCMTLIPRFDPERALRIVERDKVTVFEGVPTMYTAMLHHPKAATFDVSSLELCVSGGAALPLEVMRNFEKQFGCVIIEGYGLSETSPVASFNHPDKPRKPGSIGTPVRDVEMKLVETPNSDDGRVGDSGGIVTRGNKVRKGGGRGVPGGAPGCEAWDLSERSVTRETRRGSSDRRHGLSTGSHPPGVAAATANNPHHIVASPK